MTALVRRTAEARTQFILFNMHGTIRVGERYRTWAVQCCTTHSYSLPRILRMAGLDSYLEY
jgi:hypothetical protein